MLLRLAVPVGLLAVGLAACSAPTSPDSRRDAGTSSVVTPPSEAATTLIDLTNTERLRAGLAALRSNTRLMEAAQIHADQMARVGRLDHVLPEAMYPRPEDRLAAAGYRWQAFAENLAFGQRSPTEAVGAWMDSPGHRANILNGTYTELGTGYTRDAGGRPYYVQVFARPAS